MIRNQARIEYTKKFDKQFKKSPLEIKIKFRQKIVIFIKDKHHPQLNNHKLTGVFFGFRSINITGDWRAIFKEIEKNNELIILFIAIGTHSQLYK